MCTGATKPSEQDPRLVMNVAETLTCCCPSSVKEAVTCGVRFEDREALGEFPDEEDFYQKVTYLRVL
jgi:hypothetical protein